MAYLGKRLLSPVTVVNIISASLGLIVVFIFKELSLASYILNILDITYSNSR